MSSRYLREDLTFSQANIQVLEEADVGGKKHLYLKAFALKATRRMQMSVSILDTKLSRQLKPSTNRSVTVTPF